MNKAEILQKVKDDVAKDFGYLDWHDMYQRNSFEDRATEEVAVLYAIACCEEQKRLDAESAKSFVLMIKDEEIKEDTEFVIYDYYDNKVVVRSDVDKQSILNTPNIAE